MTVSDLAHKLTLSLAEAAQLSGLSRNHLRAAIEEKKLKARIIGRGWRVKRSDLEAYVVKL
jgi:excisionase family DNA binding protein